MGYISLGWHLGRHNRWQPKILYIFYTEYFHAAVPSHAGTNFAKSVYFNKQTRFLIIDIQGWFTFRNIYDLPNPTADFQIFSHLNLEFFSHWTRNSALKIGNKLDKKNKYSVNPFLVKSFAVSFGFTGFFCLLNCSN